MLLLSASCFLIRGFFRNLTPQDETERPGMVLRLSLLFNEAREEGESQGLPRHLLVVAERERGPLDDARALGCRRNLRQQGQSSE